MHPGPVTSIEQHPIDPSKILIGSFQSSITFNFPVLFSLIIDFSVYQNLKIYPSLRI